MELGSRQTQEIYKSEIWPTGMFCGKVKSHMGNSLFCRIILCVVEFILFLAPVASPRNYNNQKHPHSFPECPESDKMAQSLWRTNAEEGEFSDVQ